MPTVKVKYTPNDELALKDRSYLLQILSKSIEKKKKLYAFEVAIIF